MMGATGRRILVIGKDARTDAIAAACAASPSRPILFGLSEMMMPGLVEKCEDLQVGSLTDLRALNRAVATFEPDLAIVGPEEPLAAGFVDQLEVLGVPTFGPSAELAKIESSKSWARDLLDRHDIPGNPRHRTFEDATDLAEYMADLADFVVKPDGLTAGKGVKVFGEHLLTFDEALTYALDLLTVDGCVQIEERLQGQEFSLQTITDGLEVLHCPVVQDHKRAFDGDLGPNTGGMGSYSCPDHMLPFLDAAHVRAAKEINERVIEALHREKGQPYRGVLYGGFMATGSGVGLIEYNARFGDPEALNVLPLLDADFVELAAAVAEGWLKEVDRSFAAKATVCKYVVPENYPASTLIDGEITVRADRVTSNDLRWYWAACEQRGAQAFMSSSRAGAFVGIANTLADAEANAEQAASELKAAQSPRAPVRYRSDIGTAHAVERREAHMRALRGLIPA